MWTIYSLPLMIKLPRLVLMLIIPLTKKDGSSKNYTMNSMQQTNPS